MEYSFISATILLILVTDPLGNIPIFISALKNVDRQRRKRVVIREIFIAYVILILFLFFGHHFLKAMHLSDISLGIAGGVILFLIALRMVFPHPDGMFGGENLDHEPFIVPLAIPLIAGPSSLATVMLLASRQPNKIMEWAFAITIAMLVSAVVLVFAGRIQRWVGERVVTAFERLMGLILTAIAVEMLLKGLQDFIKSL
ncbi:MarC family protein [Chitinivorax sp. B]|uniref:MarC family protein n=1 Tax=Chitinivorax sp. B TaxID=2502235 RepID=UPI0010F65722|nr:MarC family protein [Chitinivorax sp. B]